MAATCSVLTSRAAECPTTRVPITPVAPIALDCIAAIPGVDVPITVGAQGSGSTRDFMDGVFIPGERRFTGVSGRGVGEERHGGDSMAVGGILIPHMLRRTTG